MGWYQNRALPAPGPARNENLTRFVSQNETTFFMRVSQAGFGLEPGEP